ncbi:MAG TPA: DUF2281 domain-containing protein [Desulfuromonadales bacterium]|nr:DUF2281 domain-containing protein [Desulfuromonadales bacterium]
MPNKALHIAQIYKSIYLLPEDKLQEVKDYIEFICVKVTPRKRNVVKLGGIWQGKGFENLTDLDGELKAIRMKATESILGKDY